MWSERGLRRTATALAVAVAVATVQPGRTAPGEEVVLDVFTTTAHEAGQHRQRGATVVCLVPVAVWQPDRPDAARFPPGMLGEPAGGGSRRVDIRAWPALAPILSDRLRLCHEKGLHRTALGGTADWGHPAGFGLTAGDWDRFAARVAAMARAHGLVTVPPAAARHPVSGGDGVGSGGRSTTNGWRTARDGPGRRTAGTAAPAGRRPRANGRTSHCHR